VLLTEVVSYLARCRIALAALAEFERRQGNADRASEVEHVYVSLNDIRQRFGLDVDDAHAHWRNLRCEGESRKCRSHDCGFADLTLTMCVIRCRSYLPHGIPARTVCRLAPGLGLVVYYWIGVQG
jgi:hypothetical protein